MSTDVERLSKQRDMIYDYMCDRFKDFIATDNHDDAMCIADEYYEWLDPDQMDNEPTAYFNRYELKKYYKQRIRER